MPTIADLVEPFCDSLLHAQHLRPNTVRGYRTDLRLAADLVCDPVDQITVVQLDAVLCHGTPKPATVERRLVALRRFFAWCSARDYCTRNPAAQLDAPTVARGTPRPIPPAQLTRIEAAASDLPTMYRLIFWLLRETGMRVGEVLHLNRGDVDLTTPHREGIQVREAKNRTPRLVPLGAWTKHSRRLLRQWCNDPAVRGRPAYQPLLLSSHGQRLTYNAVVYQWQRLLRRCGVVDAAGQPLYTLHQLRHTRADEMLNREGVAQDAVQRALGHLDPRSTQVYAQLDDDSLRAALTAGAERH